ncbi:sugar transferase [Candidatus Synechococcus calcipolaris G9]|uniref:Sugar transferase n=1 Tax=Candidatus Synechococcus calcipolaris G9 TaxID=1497997 RepID=A0ABT6F2Q5_9SYNE|nr:sugar transferase [Candidatus Synechococcus calcipolaris]MDG2992141.1 sugar transferase [Candidatus Synechococcus calcipolaris G9]
MAPHRSTSLGRDIRAPSPFSLARFISHQNSHSLLLMGSDLLSLILAWKIAFKFNQFYQPLPPQLVWWTFLGLPSLFWIFAGSIIVILALGGLYHPRSNWKNYLRAAKLVSLSYVLSLVISYIYDPDLNMPRSLFFTAWVASVGIVLFMRLGVTLLLQLVAQRSQVTIFLITTGDRLILLRDILERQPHYTIVGTALASTANDPHTLEMILKTGTQEVLADCLPPSDLASTLYWQLRQHGITLRLVPSSLEMLYRRGVPEVFAALPTLRAEVTYLNGLEYRCKRWFDVIAALVGLILLAPLLLAVAIAIKCTSPGPVFFCQERVGLHGKTFHMWKFRTMGIHAEKQQAQMEAMNENPDGILFKMKKDPRCTLFGRFLRKTSIDELPQLFNVLLGQMSLVGPRPLPIRDVARFNSWHHIRHQVLPGITGLWQISGRSQIGNFDEAARLDLYYIDNWSLNMDLDILVETVRIVCFGKGAY